MLSVELPQAAEALAFLPRVAISPSGLRLDLSSPRPSIGFLCEELWLISPLRALPDFFARRYCRSLGNSAQEPGVTWDQEAKVTLAKYFPSYDGLAR
ncbi:hypothetical protein MRB53_032114 [Persea americana]|uniref:Uncharacterized protein n=1 Tax=Persea americana TaxID=3435 RepID=A0ACC2KRF6_PERAE|nr:hypothetical protein MRB53_032114 [Persea americana]